MEERYADLHIHIKDELSNKEGAEIKDVLKEAIKNKTYLIALTSHNSLEQYKQLYKTIEKMKKEDIDLYKNLMQNMKIVIGVEINSRISEKESRHMLAYNIPIEKIKIVQKWLDENTNKDVKISAQMAQLKHLKEVAEKIKMPYEKDTNIKREQPYAGLTFAIAIKKAVDTALAKLLQEDNSISYIFNREAEQLNKGPAEIINVLNDEEFLENHPKIREMKEIYYEIIDVRLFAGQRGKKGVVNLEINSLLTEMKKELEKKGIEDIETISMIKAELLNKYFYEIEEYFEKNPKLKFNANQIEEQSYKNMRKAMYYTIAESLNEYLKKDRNLGKDLTSIQNALIRSDISFKDIYSNLRWFNSELIRPQDTPFSFNMNQMYPKLEEVAQIMHQNGAIVEVAHPYAIDSENVEAYVEECIKKGVDGVEGYYAIGFDISEEIYREKFEAIERICKTKGLICKTGGTDYHNPTIEKIGILRNGSRIKEEEIEEKIEIIQMAEFMEKMKKEIEKEEREVILK